MCWRAGNVLHIVDSYKHLGGFVSSDGTALLDARYRADTARTAYVSLVSFVFSASVIPTAVKLCFLNSLVMSRLLFNVHTWVARPAELAALNAVYARALRRIAGLMRYDAKCDSSDLVVRRLLGVCSIDSLLLQCRLKYIGRLARTRPAPLWALLQAGREGGSNDWARQARTDLESAWRLSPRLNALLQRPSEVDEEWLRFMTQNEGGARRSPSAALRHLSSIAIVVPLRVSMRTRLQRHSSVATANHVLRPPRHGHNMRECGIR